MGTTFIGRVLACGKHGKWLEEETIQNLACGPPGSCEPGPYVPALMGRALMPRPGPLYKYMKDGAYILYICMYRGTFSSPPGYVFHKFAFNMQLTSCCHIHVQKHKALRAKK